MEMIQFANPGLSYRQRHEEIDAAIKRVLESGWYILGPEVETFEKSFAQWLGGSTPGECVGVASGTDAIEITLRAMLLEENVSPKQAAIFTVSHTAVATVAAIERAGCIPVMVDINESTYTMCPESLAETITAVKKENNLSPFAVIPVHLYGHPCKMDEIMAIAEENGLLVMEDCAQAHGATYKGQKAGTLGDAASFSFYPTKNLGALGDAGGVYTANSKLAARIKELRQYGWRERYISADTGINSRLDPLQAAILQVQLKYLSEDINSRRKIADFYDNELADSKYGLPVSANDIEHAYHLYVIRTQKRSELAQFLRNEGIGTAIHYPAPVHLQPAYKARTMLAPGGLGITEKIMTEILSLPMYPQLRENEILKICNALKKREGNK